MPYSFDSRGSQPRRASESGLVPDGSYILEIFDTKEGHSAQGNYKVVVEFNVRKPAEFDGRMIKFHNVTFIPKGKPGAGIALHFLKCIGEPWEESENLDIDPIRWHNKRIKALIGTEEYTDKNNVPRKKNVIREVDPASEDEAAPGANEIPF